MFDHNAVEFETVKIGIVKTSSKVCYFIYILVILISVCNLFTLWLVHYFHTNVNLTSQIFSLCFKSNFKNIHTTISYRYIDW